MLCFMCMYTAKGTRQVLNWQEMISEELAETIFCCMLPKIALISQLKHEKQPS